MCARTERSGAIRAVDADRLHVERRVGGRERAIRLAGRLLEEAEVNEAAQHEH